jgi:hypothetical protein
MIAPENHAFDGWRTGDIPYMAGTPFTVNAAAVFTAQWKSDIASIDPNKTYVRFNNPEQFPVIIYSDPSRQQEVARVPAEGTAVAEAEPASNGIALYPSFLLTVEEISITQDAPAWIVRVDAKTVNNISIPALASMETGFAYIKIENAGVHSLTFNQGNYELIPLGAASNIIMSGETASYRVQPGDVNQNQYSVKENASVPLAFPATAQWLNGGVIYRLTYTKDGLVLSGTGSILQSIPPAAPASLSATARSWNTIDLAWESVPGAIAYAVYRARGSGGLELVKELDGLTYTDAVFASNTVCTYQVKAKSDKSCEGPASPSASAATGELPEELRSPVTVRNAEELNQYLALFNNDEYEECTLVLADSFSADAIALSGSAVLTITSGGAGEKTLSLSSLDIGSGVSLVLEKNVTLEGLDKDNWLVRIGSGGAFTMKAGSKVLGNTGGGVYVSGGTFTMSGGTISGNSANYGGGVYADGGTFTMSGGTINGNTATNYGGGVYMDGGTFTMSGGTISGNTATNYGGGVYVGSGGTFTKQSGGVIYGSDGRNLKNSAAYGSAVCVYRSGLFYQYDSTLGNGMSLSSNE